MSEPTSREIAVEPGHTALLFIDVQNFSANRAGGHFGEMAPEDVDRKYGYFFDRLRESALPNMQRLQTGCRNAGVEVLYTVIESLTLDGRDRSLDYKITGFNVPKGSWGAQMVEEIKPQGDEIVFPKSSSSVFISTNIDYILRNLGVRYLILCGVLTDQCVESAVRDACDLGYLVTLVPDCCATYSKERHENSVQAIKGYCRQRTTEEVLQELGQA